MANLVKNGNKQLRSLNERFRDNKLEFFQILFALNINSALKIYPADRERILNLIHNYVADHAEGIISNKDTGKRSGRFPTMDNDKVKYIPRKDFEALPKEVFDVDGCDKKTLKLVIRLLSFRERAIKYALFLMKNKAPADEVNEVLKIVALYNLAFVKFLPILNKKENVDVLTIKEAQKLFEEVCDILENNKVIEKKDRIGEDIDVISALAYVGITVEDDVKGKYSIIDTNNGNGIKYKHNGEYKTFALSTAGANKFIDGFLNKSYESRKFVSPSQVFSTYLAEVEKKLQPKGKSSEELSKIFDCGDIQPRQYYKELIKKYSRFSETWLDFRKDFASIELDILDLNDNIELKKDSSRLAVSEVFEHFLNDIEILDEAQINSSDFRLSNISEEFGLNVDMQEIDADINSIEVLEDKVFRIISMLHAMIQDLRIFPIKEIDKYAEDFLKKENIFNLLDEVREEFREKIRDFKTLLVATDSGNNEQKEYINAQIKSLISSLENPEYIRAKNEWEDSKNLFRELVVHTECQKMFIKEAIESTIKALKKNNETLSIADKLEIIRIMLTDIPYIYIRIGEDDIIANITDKNNDVIRKTFTIEEVDAMIIKYCSRMSDKAKEKVIAENKDFAEQIRSLKEKREEAYRAYLEKMQEGLGISGGDYINGTLNYSQPPQASISDDLGDVKRDLNMLKDLVKKDNEISERLDRLEGNNNIYGPSVGGVGGVGGTNVNGIVDPRPSIPSDLASKEINTPLDDLESKYGDDFEDEYSQIDTFVNGAQNKTFRAGARKNTFMPIADAQEVPIDTINKEELIDKITEEVTEKVEKKKNKGLEDALELLNKLSTSFVPQNIAPVQQVPTNTAVAPTTTSVQQPVTTEIVENATAPTTTSVQQPVTTETVENATASNVQTNMATPAQLKQDSTEEIIDDIMDSVREIFNNTPQDTQSNSTNLAVSRNKVFTAKKVPSKQPVMGSVEPINAPIQSQETISDARKSGLVEGQNIKPATEPSYLFRPENNMSIDNPYLNPSSIFGNGMGGIGGSNPYDAPVETMSDVEPSVIPYVVGYEKDGQTVYGNILEKYATLNRYKYLLTTKNNPLFEFCAEKRHKKVDPKNTMLELKTRYLKVAFNRTGVEISDTAIAKFTGDDKLEDFLRSQVDKSTGLLILGEYKDICKNVDFDLLESLFEKTDIAEIETFYPEDLYVKVQRTLAIIETIVRAIMSDRNVKYLYDTYSTKLKQSYISELINKIESGIIPLIELDIEKSTKRICDYLSFSVRGQNVIIQKSDNLNNGYIQYPRGLFFNQKNYADDAMQSGQILSFEQNELVTGRNELISQVLEDNVINLFGSLYGFNSNYNKILVKLKGYNLTSGVKFFENLTDAMKENISLKKKQIRRSTKHVHFVEEEQDLNLKFEYIDNKWFIKDGFVLNKHDAEEYGFLMNFGLKYALDPKKTKLNADFYDKNILQIKEINEKYKDLSEDTRNLIISAIRNIVTANFPRYQDYIEYINGIFLGRFNKCIYISKRIDENDTLATLDSESKLKAIDDLEQTFNIQAEDKTVSHSVLDAPQEELARYRTMFIHYVLIDFFEKFSKDERFMFQEFSEYFEDEKKNVRNYVLKLIRDEIPLNGYELEVALYFELETEKVKRREKLKILDVDAPSEDKISTIDIIFAGMYQAFVKACASTMDMAVLDSVKPVEVILSQIGMYNEDDVESKGLKVSLPNNQTMICNIKGLVQQYLFRYIVNKDRELGPLNYVIDELKNDPEFGSIAENLLPCAEILNHELLGANLFKEFTVSMNDEDSAYRITKDISSLVRDLNTAYTQEETSELLLNNDYFVEKVDRLTDRFIEYLYKDYEKVEIKED